MPVVAWSKFIVDRFLVSLINTDTVFCRFHSVLKVVQEKWCSWEMQYLKAVGRMFEDYPQNGSATCYLKSNIYSERRLSLNFLCLFAEECVFLRRL